MDDRFDSQSLSPIELAKRLRVLKSLAGGNAEFDRLKDRVVPGDRVERVSQILKGMEQEDEFAVMCRLMGTCDSISEIGQSPIVDSEEIAPDYLASFSPDCTVTGASRGKLANSFQCFVEVKSSQKDPFRISVKDLAKRRRYADRYGLPLIFAVRFMKLEHNAFWVLMEADQLAQNGRAIRSGDFIGSIGTVLFDDLALMTHPHLHVAHYYDSSVESPGIGHVEHGVLVRTVILMPDEKPRVIDERDHVLVNAFLDTLDFQKVEIVRDGTVTCVVSNVGTQTRFLSDVLFRINRLPIDRYGRTTFDAGRVIARLDGDATRPTLITRDMVKYAASVLNDEGDVVFTLSLGEPEAQEQALFRITGSG